MAKVYISGKITGNANYVEQFAKAEEWLATKGHSVINPTTTHFNMHYKPIDYLMHCLLDLYKCDAIFMLDNWQKSKGAIIELLIAKYGKIKIIYER